MNTQDLLEHYWTKFQSETDPETKLLWEYYVDKLALMILNEVFD